MWRETSNAPRPLFLVLVFGNEYRSWQLVTPIATAAMAVAAVRDLPSTSFNNSQRNLDRWAAMNLVGLVFQCNTRRCKRERWRNKSITTLDTGDRFATCVSAWVRSSSSFTIRRKNGWLDRSWGASRVTLAGNFVFLKRSFLWPWAVGVLFTNNMSKILEIDIHLDVNNDIRRLKWHSVKGDM